jgi:hypothetical protein
MDYDTYMDNRGTKCPHCGKKAEEEVFAGGLDEGHWEDREWWGECDHCGVSWAYAEKQDGTRYNFEIRPDTDSYTGENHTAP